MRWMRVATPACSAGLAATRRAGQTRGWNRGTACLFSLGRAVPEVRLFSARALAQCKAIQENRAVNSAAYARII